MDRSAILRRSLVHLTFKEGSTRDALNPDPSAPIRLVLLFFPFTPSNSLPSSTPTPSPLSSSCSEQHLHNLLCAGFGRGSRFGTPQFRCSSIDRSYYTFNGWAGCSTSNDETKGTRVHASKLFSNLEKCLGLWRSKFRIKRGLYWPTI